MAKKWVKEVSMTMDDGKLLQFGFDQKVCEITSSVFFVLPPLALRLVCEKKWWYVISNCTSNRLVSSRFNKNKEKPNGSKAPKN